LVSFLGGALAGRPVTAAVGRGEFFLPCSLDFGAGTGAVAGVTSGETGKSNPMLGNGATGLFSEELLPDWGSAWNGGGAGRGAFESLGESRSMTIGAGGAMAFVSGTGTGAEAGAGRDAGAGTEAGAGTGVG
jgi:hypothetical protein